MVKLDERSNERIEQQINDDFQTFTVKCRLNELLKDRGLTKSDLSKLTGIRLAGISELSNMKRTTISVPHVIVIAKALRLTSIEELFEFRMSNKTRKQFEEDQKEIDKRGLLEEQEVMLSELNKKKPPTA